MMSQLITPIPHPQPALRSMVFLSAGLHVSTEKALRTNPGRYSSSHSASPPNLGEEFHYVMLSLQVFVHDMLKKCYHNFLYDRRFVMTSTYRCRVAVSNALCSVCLLYTEIMAAWDAVTTN